MHLRGCTGVWSGFRSRHAWLLWPTKAQQRYATQLAACRLLGPDEPEGTLEGDGGQDSLSTLFNTLQVAQVGSAVEARAAQRLRSGYATAHYQAGNSTPAGPTDEGVAYRCRGHSN
jgi:hypothetical protein